MTADEEVVTPFAATPTPDVETQPGPPPEWPAPEVPEPEPPPPVDPATFIPPPVLEAPDNVVIPEGGW